MSGRLVILPKKSYCPWKPENVERVLRDERLERDRREKEARNNQDHGPPFQDRRLTILREKQQQEQHQDGLESSNNDNISAPVTMTHVNLFQAEEDAYLKNLTTMISEPKEQLQNGIMPIGLGQTELKARANIPFYLKTHQYPSQQQDVVEEQKDVLSHKDMQRKCQLDPMKDFIKNESYSTTTMATIENDHSFLPQHHDRGTIVDKKRQRRRERSKKRSHDDETDHDSEADSHSDKTKIDKRKTKHEQWQEEQREKKKRKKNSQRNKTTKRSATVTATSSATIDELRRKRRKREAQESQRAIKAFLHSHQGTRSDSYQDQYNPGLSRK